MFDCMPKILGVTWPRPRPFWGKLFVRPLGFPKIKLCTKFEVSSWSSFEDMFDPMPKIWGVTWLRPRPFWEKIIHAPDRISQDEATYQIWSLYLKFFEDTFDRMPKILGVTWPRPRPFWGKFCIYICSSLPCSSSLKNSKCLRSLTFVLPPL